MSRRDSRGTVTAKKKDLEVEVVHGCCTVVSDSTVDFASLGTCGLPGAGVSGCRPRAR